MRNFHVYIIESPSPVDLYHKRFEGEALQRTLSLSGIESSYRLTVDHTSLQASFFVGFKEYFESNKLPPIIHISAHGSLDGIQLTSKDHVSWDQLKGLLLPVNKAIGGGLLVSLSSCLGYSGCSMVMNDDDFPFAAIIGNTSSPTWSETNIAFATFYHLFHNGKSIDEAVEAMKYASGNSGFVMIKSTDARQVYLRAVNTSHAALTMQQNTPTNQNTSIQKALS